MRFWKQGASAGETIIVAAGQIGRRLFGVRGRDSPRSGNALVMGGSEYPLARERRSMGRSEAAEPKYRGPLASLFLARTTNARRPTMSTACDVRRIASLSDPAPRQLHCTEPRNSLISLHRARGSGLVLWEIAGSHSNHQIRSLTSHVARVSPRREFLANWAIDKEATIR
jgi:hypothetical protein